MNKVIVILVAIALSAPTIAQTEGVAPFTELKISKPEFAAVSRMMSIEGTVDARPAWDVIVWVNGYSCTPDETGTFRMLIPTNPVTSSKWTTKENSFHSAENVQGAHIIWREH